jgi:hypothetical protein
MIRYRSRLVVRGDLQAKSTIKSIYAATLAAHSFRIIIAIVAKFDLESKQFDVINVFVNALRNLSGEPVFCRLPDGYRIPGMCVIIDRALYGLRDSPAIWFKDFTTILISLGTVPCKEEPYIHMYHGGRILILFFVDDFQVLYYKRDEQAAKTLIDRIKVAYELRELGDTAWFLGIRIIRNRQQRKL